MGYGKFTITDEFLIKIGADLFLDFLQECEEHTVETYEETGESVVVALHKKFDGTFESPTEYNLLYSNEEDKIGFFKEDEIDVIDIY